MEEASHETTYKIRHAMLSRSEVFLYGIWMRSYTNTVSTPPSRTVGATRSINSPCRRWTCMSAAAGSSRRWIPFILRVESIVFWG